MGIRKRDSSG